MKILSLVTAFFLIFSIHTYALDLSAHSAALYEPLSGRFLYRKNSTQKLPMASTTKIATAITAIEHGKLSDVVTTSKNAAEVEGSSIWLSEGEKMSMENLLYGLMLSSGNDAAIAIAEHISGTCEEFARLMNQTAKLAGAKNTSFRNPNGLDEVGHYTTAEDLAGITAYGLKNDFFAGLVKTRKQNIPWEGHSYGRELSNHNKMLYMYDGADGVKTGYTKKSGRCLVSSATRNGIRLISVTLNAPSDWEDHTKLLDYGFSRLEPVTVVNKGTVAVTVGVSGGECDTVNGVYQADCMLPLLKEDKYDVKITTPDKIEAPVEKGDSLGYAEMFINGVKAGEVQIISENVCKEKYVPTLWDNFKLIISEILH